MTDFITTPDGAKLKIRHWQVEEPKAVVVLIHGLGEHCGRYQHVAGFFNKHDIAMLSMDLRGHGESDGKRGHVSGMEVYHTDIQQLIGIAQEKYPGIPVFLYGHSLGGNLVLNVMLRYQPPIAGVIATGAFIRLPKYPPRIQYVFGKLVKNIWPSLPQDNQLQLDYLSRDPEVIHKYKQDPLVHKKISVAAGISSLDAADWLDKYEGVVPIPILMLHGSADRLTDPEGSIQFAHRLEGPLQFELLEGWYHELHNEPDKELMLHKVVDWLVKKLR